MHIAGKFLGNKRVTHKDGEENRGNKIYPAGFGKARGMAFMRTGPIPEVMDHGFFIEVIQFESI